MTEKIQIVINGETEKVPRDLSITGLIRHYKEDDGHLIVEHNGRFVYPRNYENTRVEEGDIVEFINPNFGG